MRVVVISDTHSPRFWKRCPPAVAAQVVGADLILHAGDVCTVDVLVEGVAKGRWYGRTRTNKLVHFASDEALGGTMVDVHITSTEPWFLEGELARVGALVPA